LDPHRVRELDHVLDSFLLRDLDRGYVARVEDRGPRGYVPHAPVVEVGWPVAVEVGRPVVEDRRPRDLVVAERRLVDVRLERRPWLPLGEHDVELAADGVAAVVGRADPREDV